MSPKIDHPNPRKAARTYMLASIFSIGLSMFASSGICPAQQNGFTHYACNVQKELASKIIIEVLDPAVPPITVFADGDSISIPDGYFDQTYALAFRIGTTVIQFEEFWLARLVSIKIKKQIRVDRCFCKEKLRRLRIPRRIITLCWGGECLDICVGRKSKIPAFHRRPQ